MAWTWIKTLKNNVTGTFDFAVPLGIDPPGTTDKTVGSIRNNVATPAAAFTQAYTANESILNDSSRPQIDPPTNYDAFVYGSEPGKALRMYVTFTLTQGTSYNVAIRATRFLSYLQSNAILASTASWNSVPDANVQYEFWTWALEMDEDTEQIYLVLLQPYFRWARTPGTPNSSDRCFITMTICNTGGLGNLWDIFKDSIPGGGGGANPYDGGGTSTPGTQEATWDDTSDVISVPAAPSFNLITNTLIHAWAPAVSDLNAIGTYLWSNFDITDPTKTLSKVFQSPLESILTLHALPFAVSAGQAVRLTLAGFDTGVDLPPLTAQFIDVSCGSITIEPYWDNYLDYNPYTKLTLCLPFAGQVTLDPDEVMGKTLSVTYRVDCLTGSFVCFVYIDGDKVLGQYAGNCALSIPISAADYGRFNAAILGVAASAASAFGAVASGGSALGALADVAGSGVQEIQDAKVHVAHSGGLTGAPGFMGIQKPYLIIHRARQSVPEGYGGFKGYPLNVTKTLGECSGFTSVREIHLDGIPLTEPELTELRGILEGGIII